MSGYVAYFLAAVIIVVLSAALLLLAIKLVKSSKGKPANPLWKYMKFKQGPIIGTRQELDRTKLTRAVTRCPSC